jgi:4-aminobutyrate aminotransferase
MIADEVQTGFGRTGKMFAINHWDTVPDILVMAKGIASGYPLSGIVAKRALMDLQPPGSMGGTFVGNIVATAAAVATLDVFEQENVLQNVQERSEQVFKRLRCQADRLPFAPVDIRGLGLMIGLEFAGAPKGFAAQVVKHAREQEHLLLLTASIYETIRMIPPLVVDRATLDDAVDRLVRSIVHVADEMGAKV